MRTLEEVQKMLGKAVNATPYMPEKTKEQRHTKDKMCCFIQALNWVIQSDNEELTESFERRIAKLEKGE